jgi:hypothetical protein
MMLWLRRLGFLFLFVAASILCWVFATRFRRKDEGGEPPRASLLGKAEAIRTACQKEIQGIDRRLGQARSEVENTRAIQDEKARLQALADLANKKKEGP